MGNRFLHLIPLVLFTVMSIVAAGLMTGLSWMLLTGTYWPGYNYYLLLLVILVGIGMVISLFHLGRKERFMRAIVGVRHSWLSREVIFASVFAISTGAIFIFMNTGQAAILIDLAVAAAVISALIMTWIIGMVYDLSGRFTWAGFPYSMAPFMSTLLLGSYWIILFDKHPKIWLELLFLIIWLFDFLMALLRTMTFRRLMDNKYRFEFPHLIMFTRVGYIARLILTFCLIAANLLLFKRTVLFMIIANIILDRLCFYAGAVGVSPRSEIAFQKAERMKEALM